MCIPRILANIVLKITSTDHTDPGSRANPSKPNLLGSGVTTNDISPYIGTEISGVQISQLSKAGLDELALYTAQRKLLLFKDQDFKDLSPERQIEIARFVSDMERLSSQYSNRPSYFGPIQRHPTSGNARGFPGKCIPNALPRLPLIFFILEFHVGKANSLPRWF